ncbi:MAG: molybdopterin-synthase adenylyltransferase MoeB [Rhizobiales bacterium]|nr:molybdopterin-synthase adenylyltransferase MoeB [Hyphomicrobiales bacterium]
MVLSPQELERYARHIVLKDVGGAGQQKLKAAKVLVIGAGGLGSPLLQYLAAAGIGTIGIVDNDVVALSNLQRQIIHDTNKIDQPKTASAKEALNRINPHVEVSEHMVRLTSENAEAIIGKYDIIADGCDNFETRYLVADTCQAFEKILVSAAVGQFDGSLTTFMPHLKNKAGKQNPRYRDIFPTAPPEGLLPSCQEAGILGAITGVIGTMQALEVIKEITGIGEGLVGKLLLFDGKAMRFETIKYSRKD